MSETRLIPLTGEQHDALIRIYELQPPDVIREILVAWDAANPYPVSIVTTELLRQLRARYPGVQIGDVISTTRSLRDDATNILAVLGLADAGAVSRGES